MIADRLRALVASWSRDNGDPPDTDYQSGYMAACTEHAREVERILAEDAGGWRPIAEMPADGREVLAWKPEPRSDEEGDRGWNKVIADLEQETWLRWGYTHWMPLPSPPPQEPQP